MPKFTEDFYVNEKEIKNIETLSTLISDKEITQLARINEDVMIINDVIVNASKKTYGTPPKGGFVKTYIESASSNQYLSWNSLAIDKDLPSQPEVDYLFSLMADLGFKEYYYDHNYKVHAFQSGSSVLAGFHGVLIGAQEPSKQVSLRERYDYFKEIKNGVYYFEFR